MPIILMLLTLSGSYGFTGGTTVIQGFKTIEACPRAIPVIREFYRSIKKVQCVSLPTE